jgi:hypothetical protein
MTEKQRSLQKIKSKVDKITKKGKTNKLEYFNYVNELVDKGKYSDFLDMLDDYYQLSYYFIDSVKEVIDKSWNELLIQSVSERSIRIKRVFDREQLYQNGLDIYDYLTNEKKGEIHEYDIESNKFKYYVKNKEYARLLNEYNTFLRVIKNNTEVLIECNDASLSELENYINRYKLALIYLKSNSDIFECN